MVNQIMTECGYFRISRIVTPCAGIISVPANFRTGGGFCVMMLQVMPESFNKISFKYFIANQALFNRIALFSTTCLHDAQSFTVVVAQCFSIGVLINIRIVADLASINGKASFSTGRSDNCYFIIVSAQRGKLNIRGIIASCTGVVSVPADFRTGGRFCFVMNQIVIIGINGKCF